MTEAITRTMTRILFVDDEVRILEGLQRMLRPQRHEWQMDFAPGGKPALRMLEASSFDVIVSDMRMPEIDGASFLISCARNIPVSSESFCRDIPNWKLLTARFP